MKLFLLSEKKSDFPEMNAMKDYEEFYDFMEEYIDFYDELTENEIQKTEALESDDLCAINNILSEYQVYVSRVEMYEKKRSELFKKLGLEGKSFRQIIDSETGDRKGELEDLLYDFKDAVAKVSEYNKRSLDIVRRNLRENGVRGYDGTTDPACYDKKGNVSESNYQTSILDRQA
jgi:hypothetical protein